MADKKDVYALVGYEKKLYKMKRADLIAEAERVGVSLTDAEKRVTLLYDIVQRILKAQGIDDSILRNPPR